MAFVKLTELLIEIIDLLRIQFLISEITFSLELCIRVSGVFHFWKGIATMETTEHRAMFLSHC